jgi:hypothetical protein
MLSTMSSHVREEMLPMPEPRSNLEHPTEPHGRIPAFQNVEEEAAFWDTHDVTDFLEDLQPAEITVGSELAERLTVRLEPADRAELARRAKRLGIGPSTLARMWLEERLRQEKDVESRAG